MFTGKKNIFIRKASGSTAAENTGAEAILVDSAMNNVNTNTKTMASLMSQMNSTKSIMLIVIAGIVAFVLFKKM